MLVHSSTALIRVDAAQIEDVSVLRTLDPAPKGLGERAHEVLIRHSAGKDISVAVSAEHLDAMLGPMMSRPGVSGDPSAWEGWGYVREHVEEVSA